MSSVCPIQGLIDLISKKWVLHIFKSLVNGVDSFSGLQKEIPGINSRILSERLSELEEHELIERRIVSERPIKIRYMATDRTRDLVKEFDRIEKVIRSWNI